MLADLVTPPGPDPGRRCMAGALVTAAAHLALVEVGVTEEALVVGAALAGVSIGADISLGGEEGVRQDIACLIP